MEPLPEGKMRIIHTADEYEPIAPLYDPLVGRILAPIRQEVCRTALSEQLVNVLDLCCGTGAQAILLDRAGLRVTGVDLSPAMLAVARRKSPGRIQYLLEDATRLPFEDHRFDAVVISFALHEKSHATRTRILREAQRVLTPTGRMLLVDYLRPSGRSARLGSRLIDVVEWFAGKAHHKHFRDYMARGALEGLLAEHALKPIRVKRYHSGATGLILTGADRLNLTAPSMAARSRY